MSMTRTEAIDWFEQVRDIAKRNLGEKWTRGCEKHYQLKVDLAEAALAALRGPTREQVVKVWRGEWFDYRETSVGVPKRLCSRCGCGFIGFDTKFCENCGAPMTDEAVEMVMERMEALNEM